MKDHPLAGAAYLLRGMGLITRRGVRRFVVLPLLINAVFLSAAIYYGATQVSALADRLVAWLPAWLDWLSWLLWPLFALVTVLAVFFGFSALANLVAAPFNGFLAEAVERQLRGAHQAQRSATPLVAEVLASLASEIRKLLYFLLRALPLLLLLLVPGLNVAAPLLWFVFSAWMLLLEYADFPMANHGIPFREQRRVLSARRFLGLGFGGAVAAALMVPFLNFAVIPAAVAGATAMWVERFPEARARRAARA